MSGRATTNEYAEFLFNPFFTPIDVLALGKINRMPMKFADTVRPEIARSLARGAAKFGAFFGYLLCETTARYALEYYGIVSENLRRVDRKTKDWQK